VFLPCLVKPQLAVKRLVSWQAVAEAGGPAAQRSVRASASDEENHCSVGQFV